MSAIDVLSESQSMSATSAEPLSDGPQPRLQWQSGWLEATIRLQEENIRLRSIILSLQGEVSDLEQELELAQQEPQDQPPPPPLAHFNWLVSLEGVQQPQPPLQQPPPPPPPPASCAWHDDTHVYRNAAELSKVVGRYNQILDAEELESLFTHLEVTLFRSDRQGWRLLQDKIRELFQLQQIKILVGLPRKNRWLHVTCLNCGKFVYVRYQTAGSTADVTPRTHEQRNQLLEFFQCLPPSHLLPEV